MTIPRNEGGWEKQLFSVWPCGQITFRDSYCSGRGK